MRNLAKQITLFACAMLVVVILFNITPNHSLVAEPQVRALIIIELTYEFIDPDFPTWPRNRLVNDAIYVIYRYGVEVTRIRVGYRHTEAVNGEITIQESGASSLGDRLVWALFESDVRASLGAYSIRIAEMPGFEFYEGVMPVVLGSVFESRGQLRLSNSIFSDNDRMRPTPIVANIAPIAPPATLTPPTTPALSRTLRFAVDSTTFTNNGVAHTLDVAPFIFNDRTMVPLRAIIEAFDVTPQFSEGIITFTLNGINHTMTVGQPLPGNMGTPIIVADRTFVPLIFVINALDGATARWDDIARVAYIYIE